MRVSVCVDVMLFFQPDKDYTELRRSKRIAIGDDVPSLPSGRVKSGQLGARVASRKVRSSIPTLTCKKGGSKSVVSNRPMVTPHRRLGPRGARSSIPMLTDKKGGSKSVSNRPMVTPYRQLGPRGARSVSADALSRTAPKRPSTSCATCGPTKCSTEKTKRTCW